MEKILLFLGLVQSFTILVQNYTTMASCPGTGLEIELLEKGLNLYGYNLGSDYVIECVSNLDEIRSRVLTENAIGIGGISINKEDLVNGYLFTYPTFYTGLNVVVKAVDIVNPYSIFVAFKIEVWVLIAFTPFLLGFFSWIYNIILSENSKNELKNFDLLGELVWDAYSASMFSSNLNQKKIGKCIDLSLNILSYLTFLVMVACYASSTYQTLLSFITKFGDLAGQLVLVEPKYEGVCGQYTIYYYEFNENFYNNFEDALTLLDQGAIWGIIAENSFLLNQTYNKNIRINTYPFITFSFAGIYASGLSTETALIINQALSAVSSTNFPSELIEKYHLFYDISLKTQEQITISSCRFLFMIVSLSIIFSMFLSMLPFKSCYIEFWDFLFKKKLQTFDELELTNRTEGPEMIKNQIEGIEKDWTADMNEDFVRIIRTSTLAIIEYENITLKCIDKLIADVKYSNSDKLEIIKQIEPYLVNS